MDKYVRIPRETVERIQLYINRDKKSLPEIIKETGATYAINGGLYDMTRFVPNCHLRADGYTYSEDKYNYFGLGWNNADSAFSCVTALNKETVDNYICCVELVHQGKKNAQLIMDSAQNSNRAKTVAGFYENGDTFLFCSDGGRTPKELQDYVATMGVYEAIMLDGGDSTQCYLDGEELTAERKVHNLILIYTTQKEETDMGSFKIALGAGHGINTAGKRCMKALDPNETREWWLNDRVCDYIADGLKDYEGYSLLRMDDSDDGKDNIDLSVRAKTANAWGADIYLSIHHNAGANGTTAGGIVAFSHPQAGSATHALRDELYDALIKHTGLKGNRWDGTLEYNYQILRETKMDAVLLELGFMDSKTDVPIILSDDHAKKCAAAIVEVLVKRGKLTKKKVEVADDTLYRVQVGAFKNKANADKLMAELKAKGYSAYMVRA